jgi:hypothetical protein
MLRLNKSNKPVFFFTDGCLYIWYPGGKVEADLGSGDKFYEFISKYPSPLAFKKKVLYDRVIAIGV